MNSVSGAFISACFGFCLLGTVYGVLYRAVCIVFSLARRIPSGVTSAYERGRLLGLHDFYELSSRRKRGGAVAEEIGNFLICLVFGAGFIVVAYILADAQVRLLFPVLCFCFFALSARILRNGSEHIGVFIATILSFIPECVAVVIAKIAVVRANRTKKAKINNQN